MKNTSILHSLSFAAVTLGLSSNALAQSSYHLASQNVGAQTNPGGSSALVGGSNNCSSPEAISGIGVFAYDTTSATTGSQGQSEGLCSGFGGSGISFDVWFEWTSTFSGTAEMSTCGLTTDDTKIAIYAGSSCPSAGSALACNDDACVVQSSASFPVSSGNTYMLQLGHWQGALPGTGSFSMSQVQAPTCGQPHDGTAEDSIGLSQGGDIACLVYNECMTVIDSIQVAYGSPNGSSIANGSPVSLAVWDDPNNDGDPSDANLVGVYAVPGGVVNSGTGAMNNYNMSTILGGAYMASGGSFVGVVMTHSLGEFAGPVDIGGSSAGADWLVGSSLTGTFNFNNLAQNDIDPQTLDSVLPGRFLITLTGTGTDPNNQGVSLCDGSGGNCPCAAVGAPGAGCPTSATSGAVLVDIGNAQFSNDSYGFMVSNVPGAKPGIIFKGSVNLSPGVSSIQDADGLLCTSPQQRGSVVITSGGGTATINTFQSGSSFGSSANAGSTTYYQFWFRDPTNLCTPATGSGHVGFNFSNMIGTDWLP
jgi:hypothetical protein